MMISNAGAEGGDQVKEDKEEKEGISVESGSTPDVCVRPELIQIKADNEDEVNRRIEAFIRNKRKEVDERNIREFISPFSSESDTSCARVEAVYIHREGEKSHISLKRVENSYGPQTRLAADEDDVYSRVYQRVPVDVQRAEAVEERLANMEAHLNMSNDGQNMFSRIKALEARIGYLEGLSPEYFTNGIPQKKQKTQANMDVHQEVSRAEQKQVERLSDINDRIRQLKEALMMKVGEREKRSLD